MRYAHRGGCRCSHRHDRRRRRAPGHADAGGFTHGFLHPLVGLDHVLAMVAVGFMRRCSADAHCGWCR